MFTLDEIHALQGKKTRSFKSVLIKKAVTTVIVITAVNVAANLVEKKLDAHTA